VLPDDSGGSMLIIFYTNTKYKNLLDLRTDLNKRIFEGSYYLEDLSHQKQNLINATDFVFLRSAFKETCDEEFLSNLKAFVTLYPEKRITIVLQGDIEVSDTFINELIKQGIYNIATAKELETLREEINECLSKDGMKRYKPHVLNKPIEKPKVNDKDTLKFNIIHELKQINKSVSKNEEILLEKFNELSKQLFDITNKSEADGNETDALKNEIERLKTDLKNATDSSKDILDKDIEKIKHDSDEKDKYIRQLISEHNSVKKNLTNEIEKLTLDLKKCEDNLTFYEEKSQKFDLISQNSDFVVPELQGKHDFTCNNIHIGFIGTEPRVGVTNTALGLAKWLIDAGANTVAYVENNLHNHCTTFNPDSSTMDSVETEFGYSWEGVDIHLKVIKHNIPHMDLKKDYNFVIHDFGKASDCLGNDSLVKDDIIKNMDIIVLVGCFKGYERENTLNIFRTLKHMPNLIFAFNFIHKNFHEQLANHFKSSMEGIVSFIEYMPEPEYPLSNQILFENIIKNFI